MAEADPIKAAEQLAGSTYATAQQRAGAGKKALLDQLAAGGTYQNTIDGAAVQAAAPPAQPTTYAQPQLNALANRGAQQVSDFGQQALGAAAALAAQQRQAQQMAAGTYFDQVASAVPIEQSRAQSEAAQIMQQLINEREERALRIQQAKLSLQETQARIAADAAERASGRDGFQMNPLQRQDFVNTAQETAGGPIAALYNIDPATGRPVETNASRAAEAMTEGMPLADAAKRFKLSKDEINAAAKAVNAYNQSLAQQGYFEVTGQPMPGQHDAAAYEAAARAATTDKLFGKTKTSSSSSSSSSKPKTTSSTKPVAPKGNTPVPKVGHYLGVDGKYHGANTYWAYYG